MNVRLRSPTKSWCSLVESPYHILTTNPVLIVLSGTEQPCAKANGLFLGPTNGVLLCLAQSYCCLPGRDEQHRHDSQLGEKRASGDYCLGVVVLGCHGLYQECLLMEGEKDWRAALDICDSVPWWYLSHSQRWWTKTSVWKKDGELFRGIVSSAVEYENDAGKSLVFLDLRSKSE